jgi:hypothetical protein
MVIQCFYRVILLAVPPRTDLAQPLFEAIAACALTNVARYLVEGQCPNVANDAGVLPLHAALNAQLEDVDTPWFLQVRLIQCFSGVMAVLLPSETIDLENATSHLWMRR